MTGVLKRGEDTQWHIQSKKPCEDSGRVGIMLLQTKDHRGLPEATGGKER